MGERHEHGGKSSESFLDKNEILSHLPITEGINVLDAGCGNGYMSKEFARLSGPLGTIYSLDQFEASVEQFKQSNTYENINISLADIDKAIPVPDASIDLAYLSLVFHGFSEPQAEGFINNIKRVLKPGGTLAIIEFIKKEMSYGPPIHLRYNPEDLIEKVPFNPTELFYLGENNYMQLFKIQ